MCPILGNKLFSTIFRQFLLKSFAYFIENVVETVSSFENKLFLDERNKTVAGKLAKSIFNFS